MVSHESCYLDVAGSIPASATNLRKSHGGERGHHRVFFLRVLYGFIRYCVVNLTGGGAY